MKKIILIAGFSMLYACSTEKTQEVSTETRIKNNTVSAKSITLSPEQLKNVAIETIQPQVISLSSVIHAGGKIDVHPQNYFSVSVPMGGYIKSLQLVPGEKIKQGQVIATLEDPQYIQLQQEYLNNKTKLSAAEKEYKRQQELNAAKAGSDKVLENAKADYESMQVNARALSEKLKLINIKSETLEANNITSKINVYAPFNGFVSKVNVNTGKYVNPSDVILDLINPEEIHLNLSVFEKDLAQLSIGQKVLTYSNIHPEKKFEAEIQFIGREISADKTAEVHCHFIAHNKDLFPGIFMNADINTNTKNALAVPENAVVGASGKKYIFLKTSEYTFEITEVITGESKDGWVEITSENRVSGKEIVKQGAYNLWMMLKNTAE